MYNQAKLSKVVYRLLEDGKQVVHQGEKQLAVFDIIKSRYPSARVYTKGVPPTPYLQEQVCVFGKEPFNYYYSLQS
jgi:hypothetical protein